MADGEMTGALPDSITVSGTPDVRLTANEMRKLKDATGRSMTDLMGEEADDADRLQTIVWLSLRRQGYDVAWDQAGDVAIEFVQEEEPDPMNDESPSGSPLSVVSGA